VKVLVLKANYFPVCGAGRLLETMLLHMDRSVVDPVLVEVRTEGQPSSCHFTAPALAGLEHETIVWRGARRAADSVRAVRALVKKHGAKGVYAHDMRCDLLCRLAGARRGLGVPFVAHVHGWAGRAGDLKLRAFEFVDRLCVRAADEVWVGSQHAIRDVRAMLPRRVPLRCFENALDPTLALAAKEHKAAARAALGLPLGAFAVGMHARLHHAKGHAVLAEAALRCANQGVHAVLLGYGDEEAKLRELAALPRAKGRIHVIGQQQPVDTLASVAALDLYAYASLRESLPLAVLEAMAMGLPIVSSDVGDVASALGHGEAGVVVPPGDVTALANAIDALAADPVRRAHLGRNAERAARSRFSPQRLAREVESAWIALRGDAR
jgi:glycogen(starch) synthase